AHCDDDHEKPQITTHKSTTSIRDSAGLELCVFVFLSILESLYCLRLWVKLHSLSLAK
ncbi:hypothetical protein V8D89_000960, partial [Ganoderma adspersum]